MTYEIIISPQADQELEDIALFIAEDSPKRAISFIDELLDSVQTRLTSFPYIGKEYKFKQRMIVFKGYIIFYGVNETTKTVSISHILNPAKYSAYKHLI